ncbi:lipase 1-like isoform X2 [Zophobas morio]
MGREPRAEVEPRPVAFIHHGLLGSSDMWLLRGPPQDLPYLLADSGYDVWLFNVRGNTHSRKHATLNADEDPSYWDFGIEEIGYHDLPATIDYILNKTRQKDLFFLGHSIGSSSGLILCSLRPEYRKRIRLFLALGPLANIKHPLMRVHTVTFSLGLILLRFAESQNIHEIMPRRPYFSQILQSVCEDDSPLQALCLSMMFSIVGKDLSEFNTKTFPRFVEYYPSGTSLNILADVFQYYLSGEFTRRDFGARLNVERYNDTKPPTYDLSKVTVPVSLHYGPGDLLVSREDIDDLCLKLPLCVGKFEVAHKQFNHLDFVLAINGRSLLYDSLVQVMEKYR